MFGDIIKVTPTSKVVGDMALFMVANELTPSDILNPDRDISFPDSVTSLFKGELGFPADGFPPELQLKILKGTAPLQVRPGALMPPIDLALERVKAEVAIGRALTDYELASYLMYPKVFEAFAKHQDQFGDVSTIPTTAYFYGLQDHEEIAVSIEQGKTLHLRIEGRTPADADGQCRLFFELNGQPRLIRTLERPQQGVGVASNVLALQAEEGNVHHIASTMPGCIARIAVKVGDRVEKGTVLASVEAMKMESAVCAETQGVVSHIHIQLGDTVKAKQLMFALSPKAL
jgi:pyruvate carboxylase